MGIAGPGSGTCFPNMLQCAMVHWQTMRSLALLLLVFPLVGAESVLWYSKPASKWVEALPVGNGRLAGMVFGGVKADQIQLNEDTVWAGEKRDRMNPAAPEAIKEVRRLLMAGKAAEAEALAEKSIISKPKRMPPYQPLGDLRLKFPAPCAPALRPTGRRGARTARRGEGAVRGRIQARRAQGGAPLRSPPRPSRTS